MIGAGGWRPVFPEVFSESEAIAVGSRGPLASGTEPDFRNILNHHNRLPMGDHPQHNIEAKFRLPDPEALRQRLAQFPEVQFQSRFYQTDTFFCIQDGRLKLRQGEGSSPCLIHYRREDVARPRISAFKITPVNDAEQTLQELAEKHGVLGVVEKYRELYFYRNVRLHVDEVIGLGWFLELESVISDSCPFPEAQANFNAARDMVADLLGPMQSHAYIDLLLEQSRTGKKP